MHCCVSLGSWLSMGDTYLYLYNCIVSWPIKHVIKLGNTSSVVPKTCWCKVSFCCYQHSNQNYKQVKNPIILQTSKSQTNKICTFCVGTWTYSFAPLSLWTLFFWEFDNYVLSIVYKHWSDTREFITQTVEL